MIRRHVIEVPQPDNCPVPINDTYDVYYEGDPFNLGLETHVSFLVSGDHNFSDPVAVPYKIGKTFSLGGVIVDITIKCISSVWCYVVYTEE